MLKTWLIILGVVFLVVGLLGFVNNPVLGVFSVNSLHNLIHIVSGVLALIFAFQSPSAAKQFSLVFGIVYALVFVLGLVASGFMMSLLNNSMTDNILHLILAVVFLIMGMKKTSSSAMPMQS